MTHKTLHKTQILIICLSCLLAYSNTFDVPFHFDDDSNIVGNHIVHTMHHYDHIPFYKHHNSYFLYQALNVRYLGYLSFALNYKIHGLSVTGYHIVNLAIHLICSISVFYLVWLILKTPFFKDYDVSSYQTWLPFFCAFAFACHPIQTQAVTYIVQRFASMAAMFYVLAMVLYARFRLFCRTDFVIDASKRHWALLCYGCALTSTIFAMKSKEIAFTLPVMLVLFEFMFFDGRMKKRLFYLLPFMLTLPIIPLSMMDLGLNISDLLSNADAVSKKISSISRSEYLFTQFNVLITYLELMLPPFVQNLDYDYPIARTFWDIRVLSSFYLLACMFLGAIYLTLRSKKDCRVCRIVAFGIFWFFVAHSIESSIFPIDDVIYEHRMYLPSVGIIMAYVFAMTLLINKISKPLTKMSLISLLLMILIILPIASYQRNDVWKDPFSLWFDTVQKSPLKARPYVNLGNSYRAQGNYMAALIEYETAIKLDKDKTYHSLIYNNIGVLLMEKGSYDVALEYFKKAITYNKRYAPSYYNMGLTYLLSNNTNKGIYYLLEGAKYQPYKLGAIIGMLKNTKKNTKNYEG